MRLATIRLNGPGGATTAAARVTDEGFVRLPADDVGTLLADPSWRAIAAEGGPLVDPADVGLAPVVPNPSKVICVGLNYRNHVIEMGREPPEHPTLFAKFADSLVGGNDDITHPGETRELDWEAELAIVIGRPVRRATTGAAEAAIAGFTVLNDVTCRDWQYRTAQWLQGKAWDSSTPVGPHLVTPDELDGGVRPDLAMSLTVDGDERQRARTSDLVFDPVQLVEYISTFVRLRPGDLVATGTPGGVGHARRPPVYLQPGQTMVTEIDGIGRLTNRIVAEGNPAGR